MESKWRQNVYRLIGSTRSNWPYADTPFTNFTYLCAQLDTPYFWEHNTWTHVLKCYDFSSGEVCVLARFREGLNVLDDAKTFGAFPSNFPYGFVVESDRV